MRRGLFLVIEGTDGSGKGTQFKILADRLRAEGYAVELFDFPRYDEPSSYFVKEYLNGNYGTSEEVGPYVGSLFYALDRYQAAPVIRDAIESGKIVLANRYTGSSMAHQGTKFINKIERGEYFTWLKNLEFSTLNVPHPDMSYVLRVPAVIAQGLVDKKEKRIYTDKKRDIHEADLTHMERSVQVYDEMCSLFPDEFFRLDCIDGEEALMGVEEVSKLLWENVKPMLPPKPKKREYLRDDPKDTQYLKKDAKGMYHITPTGYDYLDQVVTDTDDTVYAFKDTLSPVTIAAAMARLSRRGDDMRVTLLDEFSDSHGKDEKLLQRVITAYGDDSVQQLVGQHIVVEGASNLLTKKLEWGRLAAYLEQSTRYIYFDKKDKDGKYRYYIPSTLDNAARDKYVASMDTLFDAYSSMVHRLTEYLTEHSSVPEAEKDSAWRAAIRAQACDAIRPVLPVATKSTVGIFASGQALESLIMHLLSDELPEARVTGQKILNEARKVLPTFLERADKPDRGGAMIAYRANVSHELHEVAEQYLSQRHSEDMSTVNLVDYWPRNEMDIIPDMLYEHSSLSLSELKTEVDAWTYDRKLRVFGAYIGERLNRRHKPGRALEKIHYSWDIVSDYGIFRDLQRHRMVDDLEWQQLTPRYGYEVPTLVENAGLADQFEACFELSLKLYSYLQSIGHALEAQYATLLGHKMRWKITYNAREAFHFHELRTSPQGHPGYRKLVLEMHEKLSQVHPRLAEAMRFVDKGEDPELTRLAAEKYTQFKLLKLPENDSK